MTITLEQKLPEASGPKDIIRIGGVTIETKITHPVVHEGAKMPSPKKVLRIIKKGVQEGVYTVLYVEDDQEK